MNAEQAKAAVDNKVTEVTSDGLVTPDEKSEVDTLIQTLESAKQTAQEKVNSVPSSTEGKSDLQTRLGNIASVASPEVNDADGNGVLDTEQLSEASRRSECGTSENSSRYEIGRSNSRWISDAR